MKLTLRIKKLYFDQILKGEKTKEYRGYRPYYKRLLEERKISGLVLHYQKAARLEVDIVGIKVVDNPLDAAGKRLVPDERVYEISLRNPRLIAKARSKAII